MRGDLSSSLLRGDLNLRGDPKFEGGPNTPLHAMDKRLATLVYTGGGGTKIPDILLKRFLAKFKYHHLNSQYRYFSTMVLSCFHSKIFQTPPNYCFYAVFDQFINKF